SSRSSLRSLRGGMIRRRGRARRPLTAQPPGSSIWKRLRRGPRARDRRIRLRGRRTAPVPRTVAGEEESPMDDLAARLLDTRIRRRGLLGGAAAGAGAAAFGRLPYGQGRSAAAATKLSVLS